MIYHEPIEWCDIWVEAAEQARLPRVLLVGDSIARSYYPRVSECLGNAFACARLTTSTCVCDPRFLQEVQLLLDAYEFAVIHFNNGLHGWDYDEEAYAGGLSQTLDFLMAGGGNSRLIWAGTTPCRQRGDLTMLDPKTERVRERNRLAAPRLPRHAASRAMISLARSSIIPSISRTTACISTAKGRTCSRHSSPRLSAVSPNPQPLKFRHLREKLTIPQSRWGSQHGVEADDRRAPGGNLAVAYA